MYKINSYCCFPFGALMSKGLNWIHLLLFEACSYFPLMLETLSVFHKRNIFSVLSCTSKGLFILILPSSIPVLLPTVITPNYGHWFPPAQCVKNSSGNQNLLFSILSYSYLTVLWRGRGIQPRNETKRQPYQPQTFIYLIKSSPGWKNTPLPERNFPSSRKVKVHACELSVTRIWTRSFTKYCPLISSKPFKLWLAKRKGEILGDVQDCSPARAILP